MTSKSFCVRKLLMLSLTFLTALCMVLALVPVNALAAPNSDDVWLNSFSVRDNIKKLGKVNLHLNFAKNPEAELVGSVYVSFDSTKFYLSDDGNREHGSTYYEFTFGDSDSYSADLDLYASKNVSLGVTEVITIELFYSVKGSGDEVIPRQSSISIPVNMADEPVIPEPEPDPESKPESVLTPHIVITGYDWGDAELKAGNELYLTVSFRNTSKTKTLQNILISITLPGGIILTKASSNFYMEKLGPGEIGTQVFWLKTDKNLEAGIANFSISFNYEYALNDAYSSGSDSESFGLIFEGAGETSGEYQDRFEITDVTLPDYIVSGEENYITVKFVNKGKEALNNVSVKLESDGMQNSGVNDYFGMLNANVKDELELPVVFAAGGNFNGVATVSYELPDGTIKEMTREFSVYVEEPYIPEYPDFPIEPDEPVMPEKTGLPFWAIVAIIVGAAAVVITVIVLIARHARRKKLIIEDEDDENS